MTEIALGFIAAFNIGLGLLFWAMGFGLLHIIYGIVMYYKYDKVSR
jgi:membrane protein CcdC involved in cytochrome C biogenesis